MYRCIIAALSFCSQVIRLPLFLSKKGSRSGFIRLKVAILCGRVWGLRLRDSRAFIALLPRVLPISLHFKRLSRILAPNVKIGFPCALRHSQYSPFGKLNGTFPRKFPDGTRNWIVEFPKGEPFNRNGMNGNKTSGKKIWKAGYTSRGCPFLWEIFGNLVYLILEVARNLNRRFWLNGICEVGIGWRSGRGFSRFWNMWPNNCIVNFFRNMTPHGLQSSLRQPCGG